MLHNWRLPILAFLVGLLGVGVGLAAWHAWVDHQTLHAIVDMINRTAAQRPTVPQGPPAPPGVK